MAYRRGFKKDADAYAREMRGELNLPLHAPLCPWVLADHLGISVVRLSDLRVRMPEAVDYLLGKGRTLFFAVTVFTGRHNVKRTICVNDANHETRQAADIAHELSHALLGHPATEAFSPDSTAEEEAKWMGPALLVSSEAALHVARRNISLDLAAKEYKVSESLMRMRLNMTGAKRRVGR